MEDEGEVKMENGNVEEVKTEDAEEVKKEEVEEVKNEDVVEIKDEDVVEEKKEDVEEDKKEEVVEDKKEDVEEDKKEDVDEQITKDSDEHKGEDFAEQNPDDIGEQKSEDFAEQKTGKPRKKVSWSDDLSYDSEEEREKERIALAELADIEAPEKPTYTDEELDKFVGYIKRITTLCYLEETDWNENCLEIIKEYLMEPKNIILCIYFDQGVLTASLNVPDVDFYDMTYFLRQQPDMIYSVDNFYDEIMFGTITESVEGSLLKTLEIVYAPILQSTNTLPSNIKHKLNMEIHKLLSKLTDRHYKLVGQTILYVPRECCDKTVEEASSDKALVRRIETIVIQWIRQLKCAIKDYNLITFQNQLICPLDEFNFMLYRYENLSGLKYQIENENVVHISNVLKNTHSSYIQQFNELVKILENELIVTKSNIEYLQIFEESCRTMETASLDDLPAYIYQILHKFRFIWSESPYYNTKEKLTKLFSYLSNQVIIQCSVSINLDSLFDGKTKTAMEEISNCIDCCNNYKEVYKTVSETHNESYYLKWDLDDEIIFNYVDSFIQRCYDMLEVCNGMIIFGRINEEEDIEPPQFGGSKGPEFESLCRNIEITFYDALTKIQGIKDKIFDMQSTEWCKGILEFRNTTKHIEVLIENMMFLLFKEINNVEEAIQVLSAVMEYLKRDNLSNCLTKTVSQVWLTLSKDIDLIKREIVDERQSFQSGMPYFSGQALQFQFRKNLLEYEKKMIDLALWMPPWENSEGVVGEYKKIITIIDDSITEIQSTWRSSFERGLHEGFDKPIMCYSNIKTDLIECNFDRNIMGELKEIYHWENYQLTISPYLLKWYPKMIEAKLVYENCLEIVIGFNKNLKSLSDEEKKLFKPLINETNGKIYDGLYIHKWNSPYLDVYLPECIMQVDLLTYNVDKYKYYNIKILKLIEDACNDSWINCGDLERFDASDLSDALKSTLDNYMMNLASIIKEIVQYLTTVHESFKEHMENIVINWSKYIKQFDILLETVIVFNTRSSLKNLLKSIVGDETIGPTPMLNVNIFLEDQNLTTVPRFQEIFDLFSSMYPAALDHFKLITRLCAVFGFKNKEILNFDQVIEKDFDCERYNESIADGIEKSLENVKEHLQTWDMYDHIWNVSKDDFFQEYISSKPHLREIDKDVIRYTDIINDIRLKENTVQIDFMDLNFENLKSSVIDECKLWQEEFVNVSKNMTQTNITAVYEYLKQSGATDSQTNTLEEFQIHLDEYNKLCAEVEENKRKIEIEKQEAVYNDYFL